MTATRARTGRPSQPHWLSAPPSESFAQSSSISACVSQLTYIDTAGVSLRCGPPLKAMKRWPSSSNVALINDPFGPGTVLNTFEPGKIER